MTRALVSLSRFWLVLVLASAAVPLACQGEAATSDEPNDGGGDASGGSDGQTGGRPDAGFDAGTATGGRPTSLTGGSAVSETGGRSGGTGGAGGRGGATSTAGTGGADPNGGRAGAGGMAGGGGAAGRGASPGGRGGTGSGGSGGTRGGPFTIFIAGDSTVQTYVNSAIHQGGWGQFLAAELDAAVKVDNRAIGGRTSRRFIEEDRLRDLLSASRSGDYLLVQFGTNDSNKTATYDDGEPYYLDPATAFRTWMQQYADGAASRGVHAIFVTPPPRNSCRDDGLSFNYSFTAYANAMKDLAAAAQVPVVDLGKAAVDYLDAKKDCSWASKSFFLVRADGTVDGTHFQENGASILASLVAQGLAMADPVLAAHLRP